MDNILLGTRQNLLSTGQTNAVAPISVSQILTTSSKVDIVLPTSQVQAFLPAAFSGKFLSTRFNRTQILRVRAFRDWRKAVYSGLMRISMLQSTGTDRAD